MMSTYGSRIKEVRKQLGLTQKEFAERVCVTSSYISRVEYDKDIPTDMLRSLICHEYNVNRQWLENGIGTDIFIKDTTSVPMINQVFKNVALQHLAECGLPESLIDGVDCSTYEDMERTLADVKNCFYSSIKKHIEDTYGTISREREPLGQYRQLTEYGERNWWEMFRKMDCDPEHNKYIANLHSVINSEMQTGEFSDEWKRMSQKENLLIKILETGINEEDVEKFKAFLDLESEMRGHLEKEGFICGFRTAYHLLKECMA